MIKSDINRAGRIIGIFVQLRGQEFVAVDDHKKQLKAAYQQGMNDCIRQDLIRMEAQAGLATGGAA